jgi:predicted metal-binding membrane protein
MLLLFAVAVMNLAWVAFLTAMVMAEKLLPGGRVVRHAIGAALTLAGLGFLVL